MNNPQRGAVVAPDRVSEDEAKITLGLLNAIEANSELTQRSIARDLGIALGLANSYLKRCVRKGLVKVQQVPANRYAYYLTPKGFAEKSRLTADYLTISFNFFRRARNECSAVFQECANRGWHRVVLAGTGDLAEIATLCASDVNLDLVGVFDPEEPERTFAGLPVAASLAAFEPFDAVVVTAFRTPQETFGELAAMMNANRILAPALLGISREPPVLME